MADAKNLKTLLIAGILVTCLVPLSTVALAQEGDDMDDIVDDDGDGMVNNDDDDDDDDGVADDVDDDDDGDGVVDDDDAATVWISRRPGLRSSSFWMTRTRLSM